MDIPLAPVEKILKKTRLHVSTKAVKEFGALIEEVIADVAAEATAIAKRSGRKTVTRADIMVAKRKLR